MLLYKNGFCVKINLYDCKYINMEVYMFLKNNFRPAFACATGADKPTRAVKQSNSVMFNSADTDDFNSFSSAPRSNPRPSYNRPPQRNNNNKNNNIRTIAIAAASVVAVILLIVLAVAMLSSGGDGIKYEDNAFACYQSIDETYYVSMNGKVMDTRFDNEVELKVAGDNSFAYVIEDTADGYNVFLLKNKKLTPICDQVERCLGFAEFEVGVIYSTDGRIRYYYDESETVIERKNSADNFVISPDGSHIVYTVSDESDPSKINVCIYSDGNTTAQPLTAGIYPIAVSNNGKYVIGYSKSADTSRELYVVTEDDKFRIEGVSGSFADLTYVNADATEYVFTTESITDQSVRTYLFNCSGIKKDNRTAYYLGAGISAPQIVDSSIARLDTVKECYFRNMSKKSTFYVNKKYETTTIAKYLGQFDSDLEHFYYIDESKSSLYSLEVKGSKTKEAKTISLDAKDFAVTNKGNIYFLDSYGDLNFYRTSKKKSARIMGDVSEFAFYEYANNLYFEKDEALNPECSYRTSEGSEAKEVEFGDHKVISAPKFTNSYSKKTYSYFWDDAKGAYVLFYTSNGKSFKFVSDCNVINGNHFEDIGDKIEDIIEDIVG